MPFHHKNYPTFSINVCGGLIDTNVGGGGEVDSIHMGQSNESMEPEWTGFVSV